MQIPILADLKLVNSCIVHEDGTNILDINKLENVDTTGAVDGNVLSFDEATSTWVPTVVSGGGTEYTAGNGIDLTGDIIAVTSACDAKWSTNTNTIYEHPITHPASIITQDSSNRFVTDIEKSTWNNKQDSLISGTNIKTINGTSLLGSGNLVIAGGSSDSAICVITENCNAGYGTCYRATNPNFYGDIGIDAVDLSYSDGVFTTAGATSACSFASGYNTSACGDVSTAIGYYTSASGCYSTAIGYTTNASGYASTAMGHNTSAAGYASTSIGHNTSASGCYSIAIGSATCATGSYSFASGCMTCASGIYSTTMGYNTRATAIASIAMGRSAWAAGSYSFASGCCAIAYGSYSTSIGYATYTNNTASTAIGYNTGAYGYASTAMGYCTTAIGNCSTSMGYCTCAIGGASTSMGNNTCASGEYSTSIGTITCATGYASTAMGYDTRATGYASTAMGYSTIALCDNATAMGYGTLAQGKQSTALGLLSVATIKGSISYSGGNYNNTTAKPMQSTSILLRAKSTSTINVVATVDAGIPNSSIGNINTFSLINSSAATYRLTILAKQAGTGTTEANVKAFEVKGILVRGADAASTSIVGNTVTVLGGTLPCSLTISADTTLGGLKVECASGGSEVIYWEVRVETVEIQGYAT